MAIVDVQVVEPGWFCVDCGMRFNDMQDALIRGDHDFACRVHFDAGNVEIDELLEFTIEIL